MFLKSILGGVICSYPIVHPLNQNSILIVPGIQSPFEFHIHGSRCKRVAQQCIVLLRVHSWSHLTRTPVILQYNFLPTDINHKHVTVRHPRTETNRQPSIRGRFNLKSNLVVYYLPVQIYAIIKEVHAISRKIAYVIFWGPCQGNRKCGLIPCQVFRQSIICGVIGSHPRECPFRDYAVLCGIPGV